MGPDRRRHLAASLVLLAVLGGYALWTWGDHFHTADAQAGAPSPAAAPPSTGTSAETMHTLPPFAGRTGPLYPPKDVVTGPLDPLAVAHAWVEEDRGRPMGLGAGATVPDELKHYDDDRRFLAVQMAAAEESALELPHDAAAVVRMLRAGTLVEVPALTSDHVLYEVGEDTTDDPMAHYDVEARKDVPLFASTAELDAERSRLRSAVTKGARRDRIRAESKLKLLATYYDDPAQRENLLREGADVASLAANWDGRSYDLKDPVQSRQFKIRLLSCVRPEARDVMFALAREYHARFHRLLPVTSLVRSRRYQRRLGTVNGNATKVDMPPHTTGCAFDVSFRYMDKDEQQLLYDRLAELERAGRIEVLRERRNHVHVYVFPAGRPPSESTIAQLLDDVEAARGAARGR
jgi:hypothetical protein